MQENFKPEFKLTIENLQEKLHKAKRKPSKGAKICASNRWKLECEKCSKTFCKIFGRQNMQNQTNTKHFSNPEDIFKSAKNFLEKLNPKEDSSQATIFKVLKAKYLTEKKLQSNNKTFARLKAFFRSLWHVVAS